VESEIPKAKFSLEWLVEKCFGLDPNYERVMFRAYSLNKLLYELCRHANIKDSSLQFTSYDMVNWFLKYLICKIAKVLNNSTGSQEVVQWNVSLKPQHGLLGILILLIKY